MPGTLPKVLQIVFGAVALGGFGDHWNLSDREAKQFSDAINTAISSMPKARKSAWLAFMKQYFPWISLVGTAATIVYPRVAMTHILRQQQRAYVSTTHRQQQSNTIPFPTGGEHHAEGHADVDGTDQQSGYGSPSKAAIDELYFSAVGN